MSPLPGVVLGTSLSPCGLQLQGFGRCTFVFALARGDEARGRLKGKKPSGAFGKGKPGGAARWGPHAHRAELVPRCHTGPGGKKEIPPRASTWDVLRMGTDLVWDVPKGWRPPDTFRGMGQPHPMAGNEGRAAPRGDKAFCSPRGTARPGGRVGTSRRALPAPLPSRRA